MFDIKIENDFDFLSAEYRELFAAAAATPFQHPAWLAGLYDRLAVRGGAKPLIITARRKGRLELVLPLLRTHYGPVRVIEYADLKVSDYAAPIARPEAFAALLADGQATRDVRRALRPYDLLRIQKLADDGLRLDLLLGIAGRRAMPMSAYAVALLGDFSVWREKNLNPSYRKELDKKSRQLHRKGKVVFDCVTDPAAIRQTFDAMRTYRRTRFEGRHGEELLQYQSYFEFYLDIALTAGITRTYRYTVDDRPVACALGLVHNGAFLVILGGFDQVGFKNQSLGALLFEQIAHDCISRGDTLLDFTIGDEPYKLTFGAKPRQMWMIMRAGSPLGWCAGMLLNSVPGLRRLAKRLRPRLRHLGTLPLPVGEAHS